MRSPPLTGQLLAGRYRIGGLLGEGGMGSVYEAIQEDLARPVAIKVMHEDLQVTHDALARFQREAKAAASLGHPNIVQVTDFGVDGGRAFLVMERLPGASLASVLEREGRIPTERACAIAVQLLSALEAAHAAGFVHRDIKPDNVFLVPMVGVGEIVKVLDFGVAKLLGEGGAGRALTELGQVVGSPAYMAPEQVRAEAVDERVDLFAVGATLYRAISGRLPFDVTTLAELVQAIVAAAPPPPSSLAVDADPALDVVIATAMRKDRRERYPSATAMRVAVEEVRATLTAAKARKHSTASMAARPAPAASATARHSTASMPASRPAPVHGLRHDPPPVHHASHRHALAHATASPSPALPPAPPQSSLLTVETQARLRAAGYDTDGTKALKVIAVASLVLLALVALAIAALVQYCAAPSG